MHNLMCPNGLGHCFASLFFILFYFLFFKVNIRFCIMLSFFFSLQVCWMVVQPINQYEQKR